MTALEEAKTALNTFKQTMAEGHPWMSGASFINNPGLDQHILAALEEFVRIQTVTKQALSRSARRVSLSDDPNWRPSGMAPISPKSKEWVHGKDDGQPEA